MGTKAINRREAKPQAPDLRLLGPVSGAAPRLTPRLTPIEPRLLSSEAGSASRGLEEEPCHGHGQPCPAGSAVGWGLGGGSLASWEVRTLPARWGVRGRFPTLFVLAVSLGARVPSEVRLF